MMKRFIIIIALASYILLPAYGQCIVEYFFDADPGYGNAEQAVVNTGTNELLLKTTELPVGFHMLSIRSVDNKERWSPTISSPILVTNDLVYAGAEYFVDEDPGQGNGITIPISNKTILSFNVETSKLSIGAHNVSVRIQHINGKWSDIATRPFIVVEPHKETNLVLEYFYDLDPGHGNAQQVELEENSNIVYLSTDNLSEGMHLMGMRAKDKEGRWSSTLSSPLYVVNPIGLIDAEWFVDTDPGEGLANKLIIEGTRNISFTVPTNNLNLGLHTLVLRVKASEEGNWITIYEVPFELIVNSGINSTKFNMDIDIIRNGDVLNMRALDIGDSQLEIYTLDGVKHAYLRWNSSTELNLNISRYLSPLIIKVITNDGKRITKMIN